MTLRFREAARADVPEIVALLVDDDLGRTRENVNDSSYLAAFQAMEAEPHNAMIVGEDEGRIVAVYQFTLITGLSLGGTRRAQIEGVRVASELRGQGIGAKLMADAEARARAGGAGLLQFTSNATRDRAHDFYRRMGFVDSHIGFKKPLERRP